MPTYEYQCKDCGYRFEKIQKFSDDPLTVCPECSGNLQKLLHTPPIHFKGGGWYITDSKSSGSTATASPAPEKASEAVEASSSADSSSDTASQDSGGQKSDKTSETVTSEKKPAEQKPKVKETVG